MLSDGGALAWRCRENAKSRPYETYIAPSFSWASVDGGVVYDQGSIGREGFDDERRLFELVDARRALLSAEEEFGRVAAGCSVTLSGALYPCVVRCWQDGRRPEVVEIPGSKFSVVSPRTWFDCGMERVVLADGTATLQRCGGNPAFEATEVHVLVLRSMAFHDLGCAGFEGLVLGRVAETGGADGYQRLGYIRVEGRELDMVKFKAVVTIY